MSFLTTTGYTIYNPIIPINNKGKPVEQLPPSHSRWFFFISLKGDVPHTTGSSLAGGEEGNRNGPNVLLAK